MSNSGEQPNPYAQQPHQPPQGPPPPPAGPQPGNPYGQVPPQQNPYGRPQPPAGYGYPAAAPHGAPGPTMPGAGPAGPAGYAGYGGGPGGSGGTSGAKGMPSWLWAIGGAVVASAVWAGVLAATGGLGEPSPDLRGYRYQSDLCRSVSWTPFEDARFRMEDSSTSDSAGENPEPSGHQDPALDSMWCNADLVPEDAGDDDYSSTLVHARAFLHKKTDPAPEFAAQYRSYEQEQSSTDYKVEPVRGIGDEAYLVTREETADSKGSYVVLGVRDGWLTYETTWSSYSSSNTATSPGSAEVADMLRTSAKETLGRMKG